MTSFGSILGNPYGRSYRNNITTTTKNLKIKSIGQQISKKEKLAGKKLENKIIGKKKNLGEQKFLGKKNKTILGKKEQQRKAQNTSPEENVGGDGEDDVIVLERLAEHRVGAVHLSADERGVSDSGEHRQARQREEDVVGPLQKSAHRSIDPSTHRNTVGWLVK